MSLATLQDIIARHPSERRAIERLGRLLERPGETYEARRLYDLMRPSSERALMEILLDAVVSGVMDYTIVVESPFGGGIAEFKTFGEIPAELPDWRSQSEPLRIQPEYVHVKYRRAGDNRGR
jgi:hypothetical protein